MKIKSIPPESPTLAEFKYIIYFQIVGIVFEKMSCFCTLLSLYNAITYFVCLLNIRGSEFRVELIPMNNVLYIE